MIITKRNEANGMHVILILCFKNARLNCILFHRMQNLVVF